MSKSYTYSDVSSHAGKKDLFLVIHDKVYDTTGFVDEHPGGEEVLLDVGGQDATEAFEDVGHSDEAREILNGLLVGTLERKAGDPKPKSASATAPVAATNVDAGIPIALYAAAAVVAAVAFFGYQYMQNQQSQVAL